MTSDHISPVKPVLINLTREDSSKSIDLDAVYPSSDAAHSNAATSNNTCSITQAVVVRYVDNLFRQVIERLEVESH